MATQGIALLLILLAILTILGAIWRLWKHQHPETTLPGLIISPTQSLLHVLALAFEGNSARGPLTAGPW